MRMLKAGIPILVALGMAGCTESSSLGPPAGVDEGVAAAKGGKPGKPGDGGSGEDDAAYTLIDLGPGGLSDINDAGVAVGGTQSVAALWRADGTMVFLGAPAGQPEYTAAHDINEAGTRVVGDMWDGVQRALRWIVDASGATVSVTILSPLPGDSEALASGVNDGGVAVGQSYPAGHLWPQRAVLWDAAGTPTYLGDLPGHAGSWATAISNAGHVVGRSGVDAGPGPRAVLWVPAGPSWTILDLAPAAEKSFAWAVSEPAGGIVNVAGETTVAGWRRPTVWTVDLATLTVTGETRLADQAGPIRSLSGTGEAVFGDAVWDWAGTGSVASVPPLSAKCPGVTHGINASGTVAGSARTFSRGTCRDARAVIWVPR